MTNMTMLEENGRVLVMDKIKRFQGIAFPGGKTETGDFLKKEENTGETVKQE